MKDSLYLVLSICERETEILGKTQDKEKAREIMAKDMMKYIDGDDYEDATVEDILSGSFNDSEFECHEMNGWYNGKNNFDWLIIDLNQVKSV